ncbi:MAG: hypothetical protein R2742_00570 [Micropruina glycogenica]
MTLRDVLPVTTVEQTIADLIEAARTARWSPACWPTPASTCPE